MLREIPFSESDFEKIKELPKSFKVYYIVLPIIIIPLSFLVGLLGLLKKGFGYWPTTIAFLSFCILYFLIVLTRDYINYRRDISKRIKLSGQIRVKRKKELKKEMIVYFESKQLKKIRITSKATFDTILENDIFSIEISKYSNHLFNLKKGDVSLLEKAELS